MSSCPEELLYTPEHEWFRAADGTVGITAHAQRALGDVVYVELPAVGTELTAGQSFGTVESVKSVSDLFAPVSGRVTAVNGALGEHPELINQDPYGEGWIIRVAPAGPATGLLVAAEYRRQIGEGQD